MTQLKVRQQEALKTNCQNAKIDKNNIQGGTSIPKLPQVMSLWRLEVGWEICPMLSSYNTSNLKLR